MFRFGEREGPVETRTKFTSHPTRPRILLESKCPNRMLIDEHEDEMR